MTLLLTLLLKSLLVFAAAGLLLLALRRASAAARHLVCLLTLGAVLLLPLCSLTLPGWHLPVLTVKQSAEPTSVRPSPALPVRESKELAQAFTQVPYPVPAAASPASSAPGSMSSLTGRTPAKQGGGFLLLYLVGLLLASARPLLGLWGIRRLSRACVTIADEPTLTTAADCAQTLGLPTPRLCRADVPVPMTWGWRRPVIVLPQSSADWPDACLRSVLLHEMAHVKRRDWPGHRLADFACALLWFHPLVWLTARRLRAESEAACDDLVLASGIPAPDYARHLLEIASALPRTSHRSHAAIAMAQTSQIESRLHMILDKTRTRRTVARRVLLAALIPGTAALVTLAVLRPDAKAQTATTRSAPSAADFRKTYASGITLSVDALTRLPADGGQWWRPDGTSIPEPVAGHQGSAGLGSWSPEQHPRALLFTATAPRPVSFSEADQFLVDGKPLGPISTFDSPQQLQPGQPSPSSRFVGFPENAAVCTLRYGIAAGPWQTAGVQKVRFSPALLSPLNATPDADFNGNVELILAPQSKLAYKDAGGVLHLQSFTPQPLGETARRIVAVDAKGVQTPLFITGSTGGNMNIIGLSFSEHSVLHNYNPKIVLAQVREFRLQTRPYEWKEFDNIALRPVQ